MSNKSTDGCVLPGLHCKGDTVWEQGGLTLWWADSSHCLAFAVAPSSDGRRVLWHAQRWEWIFCMKSRTLFHTCCCLGKLEYLWLTTEVGGQKAFSIPECGLLCVKQWCFSPPLTPSLLHPFHCSRCQLLLVCSAVTLTLSQLGDALGVERGCHFGVHHGNHEQPPSLSSVCCVHSRVDTEPFRGCSCSSALQLFSCLVGNPCFLFEGSKYSRTRAAKFSSTSVVQNVATSGFPPGSGKLLIYGETVVLSELYRRGGIDPFVKANFKKNESVAPKYPLLPWAA